MSQVSQSLHLGIGTIFTLTGDLGTAAGPDGVGDVDIVGGTNIATSSDAASNMVTIDLDGTISLTRVNAATFDTNVAAAGLEMAGTSITADGTDADIDINITAKGTGQVIIDDLQLTTDLAVTEGGTGVHSLTDGGVLIGSGTSAITALTVGTDGQVLVGDSANDPVFATITSSDSSISFTAGAGTLSIQGTAATTTQVGSVELTTDAEAVAGTDTTRAVTAEALKAKLGAQTSHGLPYGAGTTTAIAWTAEPSDGQLLIGDTGGVPVLAAITEGTNIDVTNGAGSIEIETTKVELNDQTGTTYQFVAADAGKMVTLTNAAAITLTVPANATVAFPTGTVISIYQGGAGTVTVAAAGGVTVNSAGALTDLSAQYATGALIKLDTNVWSLSGSLA